MHEVDWEEARRLSHDAGRALAVATARPETVPLAAATGRILARDITSLHNMPHYASSAMDGWVVSGRGPWHAEATARPHATAGTEPAPLAPGTARRIVTGEAIPAGATTVLRQEHATVDASRNLLLADPAPRDGADIRAPGREASAGESLLRAGMRLNPGRIAVAAVGGHDVLAVTAPVRVRLVLTGDEVVTSGIPAPGQVRDAFGPVLPACIEALGGTLVDAVRIGDDRQATLDALDSPAARGVDVLVSTGGTGHSPADHLRPAAAQLGATTLIGSVAMRPGHPAMLSRLPGGRLLVALPGNPLAALMAVVTLLEPLLAAATGQPPSSPVRARAGEGIRGAGHSHRLVPASWADPVDRQVLVASEHTGSAMMRGLAHADAVLVVPPAGTAAGAGIGWLPLPWYGR
ncbi:molybdopterin molybdotransferase MoeA [Arthrobacter sp. JSM 101049]|uniref:molybdopterin molybdotransferase MoeA n=1 Tax=Arthrobacter sp. JSM 101049 TaxID=929097 RepID=UPI0035670B9B